MSRDASEAEPRSRSASGTYQGRSARNFHALVKPICSLQSTYCYYRHHSFVCNGECPKNRFFKTPDGEPGLNYLCSGMRRFLAYAEPYLHQIAEQIRSSTRD